MKIFKKTYLFLAVATLLAACSQDGGNTDEGGGEAQGDSQLLTVGLRISPAGGNGTPTRAWKDSEHANDSEMMNIWTVVMADASGNVKAIHACKPTGDVKPEVDDYVHVAPGTYTFYSFANMAPSVVMQLLGISGTGAKGGEVTRGTNDENDPTNGDNGNTNGDNDPTGTGGNEGGDSPDNLPANPEPSDNDSWVREDDEENNDKVFEIAFDEGAKITATPEDVRVRVDGNGFHPYDDIDNGFGAKGIPMSNVQTKTITASGNVELIVVRMLAKIELVIKNLTGEKVKILAAKLSDLTGNDNCNLKLLPNLTNHDTMDATHKDIQPNLGAAQQVSYTQHVRDEWDNPREIAYTDASDESKDTIHVCFYVNESTTPANPDGLFYLTLEMESPSGSGVTEFRYALISNENSEWDYIARNDHRIIPIRLDDMKFEIIPYDFPPIGVYPVSVKELDYSQYLYEFTFHDYGHFHLLPNVTKGGTPVAFSATTPTSGTDYKWTLIDNDWSKSWFTASEMGNAWMTETEVAATGFYRTGSGSTTIDGDDEGQMPAWYVNDGGAGPQWDPAASANYRPFIFGYIADPGSTLSEDKKIYHEMRIQVYNGTTAYRQMLYRFYMTLDSDQMLYAPRHGASHRRRPHW